eukprot:3839921-Rhodomonas_salina.1
MSSHHKPHPLETITSSSTPHARCRRACYAQSVCINLTCVALEQHKPRERATCADVLSLAALRTATDARVGAGARAPLRHTSSCERAGAGRRRGASLLPAPPPPRRPSSSPLRCNCVLRTGGGSGQEEEEGEEGGARGLEARLWRSSTPLSYSLASLPPRGLPLNPLPRSLLLALRAPAAAPQGC